MHILSLFWLLLFVQGIKEENSKSSDMDELEFKFDEELNNETFDEKKESE